MIICWKCDDLITEDASVGCECRECNFFLCEYCYWRSDGTDGKGNPLSKITLGSDEFWAVREAWPCAVRRLPVLQVRPNL